MFILGFRPISRLTSTMTVIAVIAAGAMGANVGRQLVDAGNIVLTDLDGRSDATRKRAHDAGMIQASWTDIIRKADMILSIIPPRDAFSFAERVLAEFQGTERIDKAPLVFADCNAVNVVTIKKIAALFSISPIVFLDACIIGGPPSGDYVPTFYGSADVLLDQQGLTLFKNVIEKSGIKVRILSGEGAGIGDASALKMSYAASISSQLLVLSLKFLLRVFPKV
jgi:3-hydroxyisobutyrate dehydrogenase-like beta-hydroxyacid dehydrogenase